MKDRLLEETTERFREGEDIPQGMKNRLEKIGKEKLRLGRKRKRDYKKEKKSKMEIKYYGT